MFAQVGELKLGEWRVVSPGSKSAECARGLDGFDQANVFTALPDLKA
jgi:hypothetical protein